MTLTDIDRTAPVLAEQEIDIAADLDVVWALHTGVDAWPSWSPKVSEARLDGPFAVGSSIHWTSYGYAVVSLIHVVEERSRTLWAGTTQGITAVHEYRFAPTPDGVHVTSIESLAGELIGGDAIALRGSLDLVLSTTLDRLKHAAEARG